MLISYMIVDQSDVITSLEGGVEEYRRADPWEEMRKPSVIGEEEAMLRPCHILGDLCLLPTNLLILILPMF